MVCFSNTTTKRLEAFAHGKGIEDIGILKSSGNSAGVFFVCRLNDSLLTRWVSLGWTRAEAEASIERLSGGQGTVPSQSGYVEYA